MTKNQGIVEAILKKEFDSARKLLINFNYQELSDFFMDASFETENEILYDFICYLIKNERNKKKLLDYHVIASSVLSVGIPYLSYSFKKAIFHIKEAIKLNPNDISLKEHLLFIYEDPNAKEFLLEAEVKEIIREILAKKPRSKIANKILQHLKDGK